MSKLWHGAARPMPVDAFALAASQIGCELAAITAIWEVECGGDPFRADGSLARRFEPHKMPNSHMSWRDSLKIPTAERDAMFEDAYETSPNAALRASSWGGPQIMAFNAEDAGFVSAAAMVEAMAESEFAHLEAFVALVRSWRLDSAVRAHDWLTFAERYNGSGQPETYARRIESAYRRASGKASPEVLRLGDRGAAVKRLQRALGVEADGAFGPQTDEAVREFQSLSGLPVDGVVGKRTWAALTDEAKVQPKPQESTSDDVLGKTWKGIGGIAGLTAYLGYAEKLKAAVPPLAYDLLIYGAVGLAFVAASIWTFKAVRSVLVKT